MKISTSKNALSGAIAKALPAVSSRTSLPALEGFLLKTHDFGLTICAYDLELGIESSLDCDVYKSGAIVLPARIFSDIVRKLPDDIISITADDALKVTVSCGNTIYDLIGLPAVDFPEMPKVAGEKTIFIEQNKLKSMISGTVFATSTNENKPIQTGSLFDIEDDMLSIVAVDGFRLAMRKQSIKNENENKTFSFVVPQNTQREVERMLEEKEDAIQVVVSKKHIIFLLEGTTVVSRLLEGDFLNYRGVIPKEYTVSLTAETRALQKSVELVSLVSDEKIKSPVRIVAENNVLRLSCSAMQNQSYDECPVAGDGQGMEIGFNYRFLLDAVKAVPDEQIVIKLSGPLSPCLLLPEAGDDYLYLVVPVRLKA